MAKVMYTGSPQFISGDYGNFLFSYALSKEQTTEKILIASRPRLRKLSVPKIS